jgi:methionyl-tRNA synthetase
VNRALVLTQKYFDNKVPSRAKLESIDEATIGSLKVLPSRIAQSLELYRFREATAGLMDLARLGNKYLADTEPWKLYKTQPERVGTILNIALQIVANLGIVAEPFLPFSAKKIDEMINQERRKWSDAGSAELLGEGHTLGNSALLFEKIEDDVIEKQLQKLFNKKKSMESAPVAPLKKEITFDDFDKLDIRVGKVLTAEKMEKSNKLLKLTVDTGVDKRTVLSGIAQHYTPDQIIGKQVTLIANLAPRKMMGIESQGMILMAEDSNGQLKLVQPSDLVFPGSVVK